MKRKKRNKVICLLLAFMMMITLMPSTTPTIYAAYEDGDECWNCGHYHWDEYMCSDCGGCSGECTNDWCALDTHCHRCGGCLRDVEYCEECNLCKDCMDELGHCVECNTCWMDYGGDGVLCGNCRRCEFCSTICPECGMCEDCANDTDEGMHCPECGNCYQVTKQCMFEDNNHCADCCEPCDQCGECIAGDHLAVCDDCGLCVECCEFNSMMEGCESGDICVASNEWYDHVCELCMNFFEDDSELCETCKDAGVIRCPECCEMNSECSEYMCEYDAEYEEHFCMDCGACFHDVELCSTCAGADEFRCEDCCANMADSMGCDGSCGESWCCNDTYFEQHLQAEHEDHPDLSDHDPFPSNRWSFDKNSHWRNCRFCDEDENETLWETHRSDLASHSYDSNGVCTVCGYSVGSKLYIAKQPKNAHCNTSIYSSGYDEDPDNGLFYYGNNAVTFSVTAKGGTGEYSYQWYRKYKEHEPTKLTDGLYGQFTGVNTPVLTVNVSTEACSENDELQYYCVVKDGKDTVTTEAAFIKASHVYSSKYAINTVAKKPETASYKAVNLTYLNDKGEKVEVSAPASDGHRHQCLCEYDEDTLHFQRKTPEKHTFGAPTLLGRSAKQGASENDNVYSHTCTSCGYKTYYETHKHVYYSETTDFERYNRGSFNVDEAKTNNISHALTCLVDGCGHVKMENHEWDWRYMGYGSDEEGGGIFYRDCLICGYHDSDYRPIDKDGNKINWTTKNVLIIAKNAQVSRTLAKEGDSLTLTINNNSETQGKRCTGWTVEYIMPDAEGYKETHDLTSAYTMQQNDDGTWSTTVKLAGYAAGGIMRFTPTMVTCTSHSYVIEDHVAPVCMYDGFAGYSICKYCHAPDPTDDRSDEERVIPATGTDHTGDKLKLYEKEVISPKGKKTITWTANKSESNGKRYNYVAGNCTTRGCEGDLLCSACGRVVPGKREYIHSDELNWVGEVIPTCGRDGYQGDGHCKNCGKFIRKGYVTEMKKGHTGPIFYDYDHNEIDPTCTTAGKTSAQYCYTCMEKVAEGSPISPLGHDWVVDTANCTKTTTAYKCDRKGCSATKFAAIITEHHNITVDGGKAYVGGKAVAKADKGETVTLKIGTIPDGKRFKEWEVVSGGVVITNFTDPNGASFTMEDKDVTINAVFEDIPTHSVTVVSGKAFAEADSTINSAYEDTVVTIVADDAPDGKVFDKWKVLEGGVTIADVNSATTTFTMLDADVKVEATYKNADLSHSHVYGDSWKSDEDNHWKECECGDKAELAAHTFAWKTDKEATKTETGLKHEECSVCGYKRNENTEIAKLTDSSTADKTEPNSTSESSDPAKTEEHDGPSSPRTGSRSDISLWIALTLISGGALVAAKVFSKKRKTNKA